MLLAGPVSPTSNGAWILLKFSVFYWIRVLFILIVLMGVDLLLCLAVTCSLESR